CTEKANSQFDAYLCACHFQLSNGYPDWGYRLPLATLPVPTHDPETVPFTVLVIMLPSRSRRRWTSGPADTVSIFVAPPGRSHRRAVGPPDCPWRSPAQNNVHRCGVKVAIEGSAAYDVSSPYRFGRTAGAGARQDADKGMSPAFMIGQK